MPAQPEDFVALVMEHKGNVDTLSTRLGISRDGVRRRIAQYRKWGVKFPVFVRKVGNRPDIKELNQIIKDWNK